MRTWISGAGRFERQGGAVRARRSRRVLTLQPSALTNVYTYFIKKRYYLSGASGHDQQNQRALRIEAEMFEWDSAKQALNLKKHGVDFEDAIGIWEGPVLEWPDTRHDYGEDRFIATGEVDGRVLLIVYTPRGEARRMISARRASRDERE